MINNNMRQCSGRVQWSIHYTMSTKCLAKPHKLFILYCLYRQYKHLSYSVLTFSSGYNSFAYWPPLRQYKFWLCGCEMFIMIYNISGHHLTLYTVPKSCYNNILYKPCKYCPIHIQLITPSYLNYSWKALYDCLVHMHVHQ